MVTYKSLLTLHSDANISWFEHCKETIMIVADLHRLDAVIDVRFMELSDDR